ncbi:MAG: hypothetical protein ACXWUX_11935 [Allosphingosinicella sp.]
MGRDDSESSGQIEIAELGLGSPPRRFFIVDHFVEPAAAEAIFRHVRRLAFTLDDSDRADTADFNHFKHDFEIVPPAADPLMMLLAERASDLMLAQDIDCGPVYRIYANLNMFGDFQFAHEDGDGWTALLLANPEWREDWGGEFIAYRDDGAPFDYAISPRVGRLLLFDGMIRHRGGVPSKFCHEPRISIAIKFER